MLWRLLSLGVEWLVVADIRWLNFGGPWDWDGDSMYGSPTPRKEVVKREEGKYIIYKI